MQTMPGDVIEHRVIFTRHPETVANTKKFYSGRTDIALSERGLKQRERAVEALAAFAPDRVWASPLSRAADMARMVAEKRNLLCQTRDDLLEIDFGPLECKDGQEIDDLGYVFPWPYDEDGRSCPPPGAESFEDLKVRAEGVLQDLALLKGKSVVVTHGCFMRMLFAAALHQDPRYFWNMHILNVSSMYFTYDGKVWALGGFNMTPEALMDSATQPNAYDTRDLWNTGRMEQL